MDPSHPETPAPPTEQGEFAPWQAPATWPTAVGVISIVFGVLGLITYAWSSIAPFFPELFASYSGVAPSMKETMRIQRDTAPWVAGGSVLESLCSLLLLIGGIGMTGRRPWSTKAARTWAVLKLIVAVVATIIGFCVQRAVYAAMAKEAAPGSPAAATAGMGPVFVATMSLLGFAWAVVYPIFMLIWLSRPKVLAEIARWKLSPP